MSTTIAKRHAGGHACNCGCSGGTGQCCELECLVQPRFFCGQLLTDQDLSVLLDWVKGKTALSRYRHGWGVVCGLEVGCDADEGHVSIQPGYAVDCCGNDIIVCEPASFDLTKYCKPEQDPCADQPTPRPVPEPGGTINVAFGGWTLPRSEVQAVDLFVRYNESATDARTALARGGCAPAEACECTRTREGFEFYARKVEHCYHDGGKEGETWGYEFRAKLSQLIESLIGLYNADWRGTAERLERWLKANPLHSFCFVREWLCDILRRTDAPPQGWYEQMAFWIIQDWRNQHIRCDCNQCGPDAGVPLARVWLWRQTDANRRQRCKVVNVNYYPPFRRPLQQDCWPAPPDQINLARYIWQPMDGVASELYKLNIELVRTQRFAFNGLKDLYAQFLNEVMYVSSWVPYTDRGSLVVYYADDNCGRARVVNFRMERWRYDEVLLRGDRAVEESVERTSETVADLDAEPAPEPPAETARDVTVLAPDHPALDLRNVRGIGDATASKLKEGGISNLRELANANPEAVKEALSSMPINPPDEVRSRAFIDEAAKRLAELHPDTTNEAQ